MDTPTTASSATPVTKTDEEKKAQRKKKEYRDLRAKIKAMRESSKSAVAERKSLQARLAKMASELGLPAKGSGKPANAGAGK